MRDVRVFKVGKKNSLCSWHRIRNPLRVTFNFIVISIARILPSLTLKRALLRLTGMNIGKDVSIGLYAMFDIFFPELITLGDNSVLGYNCTILCHEFLVDEYRIGEVVIGRNVMVGANTTVLPGVTVGDGAVVSACSLVNKDVEAGDSVGGVPIQKIRR